MQTNRDFFCVNLLITIVQRNPEPPIKWDYAVDKI